MWRAGRRGACMLLERERERKCVCAYLVNCDPREVAPRSSPLCLFGKYEYRSPGVAGTLTATALHA